MSSKGYWIALALCLIALMSFNYAAGWCSGTDCNIDWAYRQQLELNTQEILSSDVTNDHAILVDINSDNTDFWANVDSDGKDVRFTNYDGTIDLNYHFEVFNSTTDNMIAWVRVPNFYASYDTNIYMYYGNASALNAENEEGTYPSTYQAVWHMDSLEDSTINNNDLTNTGATLTSTGCRFGDCYEFDGSDHMIYDNSWWDNNFSFMANYNSDSGATQVIMGGSYSDPTFFNNIYLNIQSTDLFRFEVSGNYGSDTGTNYQYDFDTYANSNWWFAGGSYTDGNNCGYIDTNHDCSGNKKLIEHSWNTFGFGRGYSYVGGYRDYFDGHIDEAKYLNYQISIDEFDLLNASETGTLVIFGAQESFIGVNASFNTNRVNTTQYLWDTSTATDTTINSWSWEVDSVEIATTQNASFTVTTNTDYNTCLTVSDGDGNVDSTCTTISVPDIEAPTTTFSSEQVSGTTDQNITLTCTDNNSGCQYINFRINNGDWNYYSVGDNPLIVIYSGAGDHNIEYFSTDNSDNNESTNLSQFPMFTYTIDQDNSKIDLTGATTYNGYTVTTWVWTIDGTTLSGTTNQTKEYYTTANQDLNTCLTTNSTDTYCQSVETWDTINPTIDVNISNDTFGFTSDFNISWDMACYDNFSPINYSINWINDGTTTTLYDSDDTNASVYSSYLDLNEGQAATLTFTCKDDYNNTASYTSTQLYALLFRLVNESTGVALTSDDLTTDYNIVRVYTIDGNFEYDFKDANVSTTNFFSPSDDLWFEFGYDDGTKINRQINFSYIDDQNIAVCVPEFQTFYQQRFAANSAKVMVLNSQIADCHVVAGQLSYVYDTGYSLTTYTIPRPYYLYTYIDNVKTYLALIDGGTATAYNLDAIEFSRTQFELAVGQDTVSFYPVRNGQGIYDNNTLQIYYYSYLQNNDSTKLQVYNDSNLIFEITENTNPNEFTVNFYWEPYDLNNDDVLELIVTSTVNGTTSTKSYFFNVLGNSFQNDTANNEWAAIVAVLFFLFGITLVSVKRAFGIFGIIICIISLFLVNLSGGAWWINLLGTAFIILIMYIILVTKQTGGNLQ